uniref:L1 transposable element RRM domain-containing protein n=1 Tax=Myripristis murdjan TaxID=586833 RepID=A0A667X2L4_9TELE
MDKKTADIQTSLSKIETSLSTLSEQVQELETRVGANEDNINEYCSRTEKLEKQVSFLKEKVDDLENRSRRSNVRIINIPEKMEGRDTTGFLEQLIPKLLGHDNFSSPIVVERAHRIGKVSDRPRPIIAKFLNFTHKEKVLRLAREKGDILLDNKRISFYPDYSAELQRKRDEFNGVKKNLREKNIDYALFYPSKLRIRHQGTVRFFSSPAEVQNYLSELEK